MINEDRKCVYKFLEINTTRIYFIYFYLFKCSPDCKYLCKITCQSILYFEIFDQTSSVNQSYLIIDNQLAFLQWQALSDILICYVDNGNNKDKSICFFKMNNIICVGCIVYPLFFCYKVIIWVSVSYTYTITAVVHLTVITSYHHYLDGSYTHHYVEKIF